MGDARPVGQSERSIITLLRFLALAVSVLVVVSTVVAGVSSNAAHRDVDRRREVILPALATQRYVNDAMGGLTNLLYARVELGSADTTPLQPFFDEQLDLLDAAGLDDFTDRFAEQRRRIDAAIGDPAALTGPLTEEERARLIDKTELAGDYLAQVERDLASYLSDDMRRSELELRRAFWLQLGIGALTIALLAWSARKMASSIAIPLRALRNEVRRHEDDLSTPGAADEATGSREVSQLGAAFNRLVDRRNTLERHQRAVADRRTALLELVELTRGSGASGDSLTEACRIIGEALHADRCGIFVRIDDDLARYGWRRPGLDTILDIVGRLAGSAMDQGLLEQLFERTIVLDDVAGHEDIDDEIITEARMGALLSTPIRLHDQFVGVLGVTMDDRTHHWQPEDVETLERAADHLSQLLADRQYVRRLEELDRHKSDFLATASHELRTPLTSIAGYLEMLEDGDFGAVADEQRHALEIIHRNTVRLRNLIGDLLVLNRIESTGLQPTFAPLQLDVLVDRVVDSLAPIATGSGVTIVRASRSPAVVDGDSDQLERAITNVVGNAIKFTPAGGEVTVAVTEDESSVRLIVHDTGIGIPAADLAHIATRFFRASNAQSQAIQGTGLGLAIVHAIIEVHRDTVELESTEGVGTTITVTLPLARDAPAAASTDWDVTSTASTPTV